MRVGQIFSMGGDCGDHGHDGGGHHYDRSYYEDYDYGHHYGGHHYESYYGGHHRYYSGGLLGIRISL